MIPVYHCQTYSTFPVVFVRGTGSFKRQQLNPDMFYLEEKTYPDSAVA